MVIFLAVIGIAVAIRRAFFLIPILDGHGSSSSNPLDTGFARHPILSLAHIIPGTLFMVLGPLQFWRRKDRLHRWSGRIFLAAGLVIGVTALAMSFCMSIGGVSEAAATTLFSLVFLVALA